MKTNRSIARLRRGALLIALTSPAGVVHAQTQASTDGTQIAAADDAVVMETVVVTAAGFEQKIPDAPASITVITRKELQSRPHTSLVDALRDVEGVDVGMGADKNGQPSVSMRGMPADYTLVLIDGKRQSNTGDIYPNDFGGGQFSYMPPLEAIERIEVIRGPMSTLYGSDAIGGVINIITRKITDKWAGNFNSSLMLQEDSRYGDEKTTDLYASGPLIPNKLGLAVRGSYYDRDASNPQWAPLPLTNGGFWERDIGFGGGGRVVASTTWNAGGALTFRPTDKQDLVFDYFVNKQTFDNTQGQTGTLDGPDSLWRTGTAVGVPNPYYDPNLPTGPNNSVNRIVVQPRVGYTPEQRFNRQQWSLTHTGRWDFGRSEVAVTQSKSDNLGRSLPLTIAERAELQDIWNNACVAAGRNPYCSGASRNNLDSDDLARFNALLPRPLRTLELENLIVDAKLDIAIGGAHVVTVGGQYIDSEMEDGTFGMFGDGFVDGAIQPHKQWALFAEDNWSFWEKFTLTSGVRYDHHNQFGSQVSPRGYLVWKGTDRLTLKGGVSTGYKAPKQNQLYPGITGFGGQGVSPFVGTPDLQPETSVNTEFAVYYDNEAGYSVNATVFLNRFKDKIASGDNVPNCEVAAPGQRCVDIGPGWADLGFLTFGQNFNIDKAETRGLEVAGRARLPAGFSVRGNYTLIDSEQKSGPNKGKPIPGTNPARHLINAFLEWKYSDALNFFLQSETRLDRYDSTINVIDNSGAVVGNYDRFFKDYTILHLGSSLKASDALTFNARINNLLNKDFLSMSGCTENVAGNIYEGCYDDYRIKDRARSYWLGTTMRF